WIGNYPVLDEKPAKNIGLVLAGNIPMVGLHDVIATFLSGQKALIKYSEKDNVLIPALLELLHKIEPATKDYFEVVDRLKNYNAVIATGSNNTAAHFSYYFKNVPHIIRQNRNSVAIIHGNEHKPDFDRLAEDIFLYFGLGCRNVSKIYVPEGFQFNELMESFDSWKNLVNHNKYKNNLDYNHALYLLNNLPFLQHECIFLRESEHISSRVGSLHY